MAEEQREAMEQQAAAPVSSLLDEIIEASKIKPTDEGYDVTRAGLQEFIREIASSGTTPKVSGALVDAMIVELDKKLSDQVNEIMHNEQFRELESSWRSLKFLVDNVDFRQNTKVEILNVSKQDLIDDFEDAPEVVKSGLYKHIYTAEFGQFGGQPVGDGAAAQRRERFCDVARPVPRRGRQRILRHRLVGRAAESQGSPFHIRDAAVHEMALPA